MVEEAKSKAKDSFVLFASAFLIFFLFRSSLYTSDSIFYASHAYKEDQWFHPHHLVYPMILRVLTGFLLKASLVSNLVDAIQGFLSAVTALSAVLIYHLSFRMTASRFWAFLSALLFFSSRTVMQFASEMECYPLSVFSLLMAVHFAVQPKLSRGPALGAVLFLALAFLTHQMTVLSAFAIALFLFWETWERSLKRVFFFFLAVCLVVLLGYVAAFAVLNLDSIEKISKWITSYTHLGTWGSFDHFAGRGFSFLVKNILLSWVFFKKQAGMNLPAYVAVLGFYSLIFIGLWRSRKKTGGIPVLFVILWFLPNLFFILWWKPDLQPMHLFLICPTCIAFSLAGRNFSSGSRFGERLAAWGALAGVLLLLGNNFVLYLRPRSELEANQERLKVERIHEYLRERFQDFEEVPVVAYGPHRFYLNVFYQTETLSLQEALDEIQKGLPVAVHLDCLKKERYSWKMKLVSIKNYRVYIERFYRLLFGEGFQDRPAEAKAPLEVIRYGKKAVGLVVLPGGEKKVSFKELSAILGE